ncbi:MAG: hypothetical protein JNK02_12635 [Planctomycetes bacterium]|nr:hypothetical protein [Planctomycetota bacterium]
MTRAVRALALAVGLGAALAACSAPSLAGLPLVSRGPELLPVEGLEAPGLRARARGAVLSGRGEGPIEILLLPSGARREHAFRGELAALAGPAPDGTFVYAVRDERLGLALRRAHLDGSDAFVARLRRPVGALALAPDARTAAVLAPFDADDPAGRGGTLAELVLVDLVSGEAHPSGLACWKSTPAWIDAVRVAVAVVDDTGARWIAVHARGSAGPPTALLAGERAVAAPDGTWLVAFERRDGALDARRSALDGGVPEPLVVRGALEPLALLADGLLLAYAAPTLGAEPQWEFDLLGPQVALATIKLHDLAQGSFQTVIARASPRRLWSAGSLGY